MPSIRVSDCRVSGATRNEGWPDSPTVKRNEGMEKRKMKSAMKWSTLCAGIAVALSGIWHVVGYPILKDYLLNGAFTDAFRGTILTVANASVNIIYSLSLVAFFTILFIRQK